MMHIRTEQHHLKSTDNMYKFNKESSDLLLRIANEKNIFLEGNILKVLEHTEDPIFNEYISRCISLDKDRRRKRLDITKTVQKQNSDLKDAQDSNYKLMSDLKEALESAEEAKLNAENDLSILQKRTQFKLINLIVKVALGLIGGVGLITTILYVMAMFTGKDTQIIGSTWSNMFGILLTNAFSIIGTIMGVKYASEKTGE